MGRYLKKSVIIIIMFILFIGGEIMEAGAQPPLLYNSVERNTVYQNTAEKAIATAKSLKSYLRAGRVWISHAPRGEIEVKGAVLYQNAVVMVIHFDPATGEVLPRGYHPFLSTTQIPLEKIQKKLEEIIPYLEVLNGAEYREPELCWAIPVSYKGKIVGHIKIYYDGIRVVPDFKAQEEMQYYLNYR